MKYLPETGCLDLLKDLFCVSFGESSLLADEIIGYASEYGEIHYLTEDGKPVSMLCLATLEDGTKYLFAVATSPDFRNKGLFCKNLSEAVNDNDKILCIPENKKLFSLYQKLGFNQVGFVLNVFTRSPGNGSLKKLSTTSPDLDTLYDIYKSSSFFPKKPKELFESTIRCHILYGGHIISDGSFYALCTQPSTSDTINELCVPKGEENRIPLLIKGCSDKKSKTLLPVGLKEIFSDKKGEFFLKRSKIYAAKHLEFVRSDYYINLLYN